jgi:hypothetical protein
MDLETGRQMYFLGKLVKKATKAVKKVVKSPIGKAALIGAIGFGIPGVSSGFFSKGLAGTKFGLGAKNFLANTILGTPVGDFGTTRTGGILEKALGFVKDKPFQAITAASTVAGLLTPQQEEEAQQLADNTGIDIEEARNQILKAAAGQDDFRARAFKADGGIMRLGYQEGSKEPVAKKTMPLLDMGGKEMDLREDGGFVPIGRMEKADDVPARLSKNEFVFTADAVRNAGDGNVDKGAEVMYNMMKNLESGGDVSEESQGLEGAREGGPCTTSSWARCITTTSTNFSTTRCWIFSTIFTTSTNTSRFSRWIRNTGSWTIRNCSIYIRWHTNRSSYISTNTTIYVPLSITSD